MATQADQATSLKLVTDYVKTAEIRQQESEDRQKTREQRIKFWLPIAKWIVGGVATVMVSLGLWVGPHVWNFMKAAFEDYLRAHPLVMERLKTSDSTPAPAYDAKSGPPQAARIPSD